MRRFAAWRRPGPSRGCRGARRYHFIFSFDLIGFRELISEKQYQAGAAFGEIYHRHQTLLGMPSPGPRLVAGLLINEGIFGASPSEPVLEVIEKVRRASWPQDT